jgi:hypothetical protein
MDLVSHLWISRLIVQLMNSEPQAVFALPIPPLDSNTPKRLSIRLLSANILANTWRHVPQITAGISVSSVFTGALWGA